MARRKKQKDVLALADNIYGRLGGIISGGKKKNGKAKKS